MDMNLKHAVTLIPLNTMAIERAQALSWTPNNQKLAVARTDRVIQLFDDKGGAKDKFVTRPRDTKSGLQSFIITALAFSPDSISLAVAQSDSIIFIYKIGEDFKMKKAITHKFPQPAPVTTLVWPSEVEIICGLSDGKIRQTPMVGTKGPKSKTAFATDGCVAVLVANNNGTEMVSSFGDGKIAIFSIGNPDHMTVKLVIRHPVPAVALALGTDCVFAGGSDMKISIYDKTNGKVKQCFDYSKELDLFDMSCAVASPTGQTVVFASFNKLRIYHYATRKKTWEEGRLKKIKNLYTPTALHWKRDGSCLALATNVGTFHLYEAVYKRSKSEKFEVTYITPSNVVLRLIESDKMGTVRSKYGSEIVDVQLMGKDQFIIARTTETLIICNMLSEVSSEIPWSETEDKEKFYFENLSICMIFNQGEMTLVEYGRDEVLGTFRTELVNPHVISVRVNERISKLDAEKGVTNKKLAYLLDLKSIAIVDLEYGLTLGHINHDSKVDWLELNETGVKLLYRDRRTRLILVDIDSMNKHTLDQTCGFVQWVPGSDVIVAQSKKTVRIWYNLDTPEMSVDTETRGLAVDVIKENGISVIVVKEGSVTHEIPLDQSRIEFTTAIECGDLARAAAFLDTCELTPEVLGMWTQLAKVAGEATELRIAHKAYAAIGDVPRAKFLQTTVELCKNEEDVDPTEKGFWKHSYEVQARMYLMSGQIKMAEAIYLNHRDVDRAIKMYETLQKWDEAITLAKIKHHPSQQKLIDEFLDRLIGSGQYEVAAEFLERHGRAEQSISLYLEGGYPTKAAKVIMKNLSIQQDKDLLQQVCNSLLVGDFMEETGELFEVIGQKSKALECYRRGNLFDKAIKLAKLSYPNEVVQLEEDWGDYLAACRQLDAAANHYIEAGCLIKGLDAAIESRQWKKAAQILEAVDNTEAVSKQWIRLGDHYNSLEDLSSAERCYLSGGAPKKAVEMYTVKDRWEDAHRIATQSATSKTELQSQYVAQAKALQEEGRYMQAEKLLVAIGEVDIAISMYAKNKMYEDVLRLVETHHKEHLNQTLRHLAEINLQEENLKAAEIHYIKGGMWEEAVEFYQRKGLWEDACRVARLHGGIQATKNVIFKWAAALPAETAVKLLNKFGYIYDCIDYQCLKGNFQIAEEIADLGARDKMLDIQIMWAQHCAEKGDLEEAEVHYLNANLGKQAVDMWIEAKNVLHAIETAERYAKEELQRVLLIHAENLFDERDFNGFESIIMRAEKPEIAIELYKNQQMWAEAFRLCKQYAPHLSSQLQAEYEMFDARKDSKKDPEEVIEQAKEFERQGEYRKAIERYLQLTPQIMDNDIVLARCWTRAAELASKFLMKEHADFVMKSLASMLGSINRHAQAASLYSQCGGYEEAINALIAGDLWTEAKRLAKDLGPQMEDYVKLKHTESLRTSGQVEELEDVNIHAALDLLCEQGLWSKCLERAKKDEEVLSKYLARYITHLVKSRVPREALKAYVEYGTPSSKLHFTLYKALATLLFMDIEIDDFETWTQLRNIMFDVVIGLNSSGADHRSKIYMQMDNLLWIAHYFVNKHVFSSTANLETLAAKISVSLLRFAGVIPVERAFFDAGTMCRKVGWNNMAFVFLNHYLDIRDAIDEGTRSTIGLDHSDFLETDIPTECDLPEKGAIPSKLHDEVKEWVLAASMDANIHQVLKFDDRNVFEASLQSGDGKFEPCVLTGYPVTGSKVSFHTTNKFANKEDWNRFIVTSRSEPSDELTNILDFITTWCGANPNYSF